jgi:uncharacterized protein (DUF433 family)
MDDVTDFPQIPDDAADRVIEGVIWVHHDRMGGEPCFMNSRVPVRFLFEHLQAGDTIDEFLEGFEGITREQCEKVIALASKTLVDRAGAAA